MKNISMDQAHMSMWFALHVRSRREKAVAVQLEAKKQEVFLPLYSVVNKWADRSKQVSLPLFPGYVFCRFEPALRSNVLATSGVIDVVRMGPDPTPIEDSEINGLKLIVASGLSALPHAHLAAGQKVAILQGPLTGLFGTLTDVRNSLWLVVSVELLCRSVSVKIERDWIAPYGPARPATAAEPCRLSPLRAHLARQ